MFALGVAAHETCETSQRRGLQARSRLAGPDQLENLHRLGETLDRYWTKRFHMDVALCQAQGVGAQQNVPRVSELLHARRQMRCLPDRAVVHAQITADRTHDDIARVEPDADAD